MLTDTYNQLAEIIVEVTGNSPESIEPDADLEEDLGIVLDEDFERLIKTINQTFNIELEPDEISEVVATVGDLAAIIDEEIELG